MKRKTIITTILLFLALLQSNRITAQWAGEDKELLRSENNDQRVTLSVMESLPDACYKWTGPHIIGDANQPTITANPRDSINTYRCKRFSNRGVEEDEVIVKLVDSVAIVSITPLHHCYESGDPILREHFKIVTKPKGYEQAVQFSPIVAEASTTRINISAGPVGVTGASEGVIQHDVVFSLTHHGHTSRDTVQIDVIPEEKFELSTNPEWKDIYELFTRWDELEDELLELMDKINSAKGIFARIDSARNDPQVYIGFEGGLNFSLGEYACCNNQVVSSAKIDLPVFTIRGDIGWSFPILIPPVPGLGVQLSINIQGGISIGPFSAYLSRSECFTSELPFIIFFTVGGAADLYYIMPQALSGGLVLEGACQVPFILDLKTFKWHRDVISFTISLSGRITVLGFTIPSAKWNIHTFTF